MGALLGRLRVEDAAVREHADAAAVDAAEAADERGPVERLELGEAAPVEHARQQLARVVELGVVRRQHAVDRLRGVRGLLARGVVRGVRARRGVDQVVHELAALEQGVVLVVGRVVHDAAVDRVRVRAAERLRGDLLARRRLDERRPREEDRAVAAHDDGLVGHGRLVGAAGRAGPEHAGDLGDALRRHARLVVEDAAEVVPVREDLVLERQEGAAAVDEVDAGQLQRLGDGLGAQVLLDGHGVVRAALDRRVVRDEDAVAAPHGADGRDDAAGRDGAAVHAVGGQGRQLEDVRARVADRGDALARQPLAARPVPRDALRAAALGQRAVLLPELGGQGAVVRDALPVGVAVLVELRLQDRELRERRVGRCGVQSARVGPAGPPAARERREFRVARRVVGARDGVDLRAARPLEVRGRSRRALPRVLARRQRQRLRLVHLVADAHEHVVDKTRHLGLDLHFELHERQDDDRVAARDGVARPLQDRDDGAGRRRRQGPPRHVHGRRLVDVVVGGVQHLLEEARRDFVVGHARVVEDRRVLVQVRVHALDDVVRDGVPRLGDERGEGLGNGYGRAELGHERVVERRRRVAGPPGVARGVDAVAGGLVVGRQDARVLGLRRRRDGDAALHGPVFGLDGRLREHGADVAPGRDGRERLAPGDAQLTAHEVDARRELRDRVLDLDARVDLHEEGPRGRVVEAPADEELDGARVGVARGPRQVQGARRERAPQLLAQVARRAPLDDLLVPPLHGAVALEEVDAVAVRVPEHLDLEVLGVLDELLDEDARVPEGRRGLARAALEVRRDLGHGPADAHAPAAAAGRGLEHDGELQALRGEPGLDVGARGEGVALAAAPGDGHAEVRRQRARGDLVAEGVDGRRRRPDEDEAVRRAGPGEGRGLAQEAVARVHRARAGCERRGDDAVDVQVGRDGPALGPAARRLVADDDGRRRRGDVRRARVLARAHGDALEAFRRARAHDAQGNFAAIGHEHAAEGRTAARVSAAAQHCAAQHCAGQHGAHRD